MDDKQNDFTTTARPDLDAMEAQRQRVAHDVRLVAGRGFGLMNTQLINGLIRDHAALILYTRALEAREQEAAALLRELAAPDEPDYNAIAIRAKTWLGGAA